MNTKDDFLRAVDHIYAAGLDPDCWGAAIASIGALLKAPKSHMVLTDKSNGPSECVEKP